MCEKDHEVTIYDFNYTEAINTIRADAERVVKLKHIKVHGSAVSNNIVFGVDDRAYINKSDSFLYKSASLHYNSEINIAKAIGVADQVIIIGHSLGETDHFYFDSFFQTQAMQHAKGKDIIVTYHSGDGLDGITKQLMEMSVMNLSGLRMMNKVVFKEI